MTTSIFQSDLEAMTPFLAVSVQVEVIGNCPTATWCSWPILLWGSPFGNFCKAPETLSVTVFIGYYIVTALLEKVK